MVSIEELRTPKVFKMAIFDLVGTFAIAFLVHLSLWMNQQKEKEQQRNVFQYIVSLMIIFVMFLGLGIVFHKIFGIKSALSGHLGLNEMPR